MSDLARQANLLLGADLMIAGDRPLPPRFAEQARARGLAVVDSLRFSSMVHRVGDTGGTGGAEENRGTGDGDMVLTEIKAFGTEE